MAGHVGQNDQWPRTAIVTGAASGIGRCFAETLAAQGVPVGLIDVAADRLAATAGAIAAAGGHAETCVADVSAAADIQMGAEQLLGKLGGVEVLVHCAAILGPGAFATQAASDFERVVRIDLFGTANVLRAFLPALSASRGAIGCLASTAAVHGWPNMSAYSAAKFGVAGFCDAVRAEVQAAGVCLTAVFPLLIDTPLLLGADLAPILKQGRPIAPAVVVRKTLAALARRRPRVYIPETVRLVQALHGLAPSVLDWYGRRFGF
jgi:NAD(P)-dependent dehydrogenase (short-subunit alcohol dehydrogenase family)